MYCDRTRRRLIGEPSPLFSARIQKTDSRVLNLYLKCGHLTFFMFQVDTQDFLVHARQVVGEYVFTRIDPSEREGERIAGRYACAGVADRLAHYARRGNRCVHRLAAYVGLHPTVDHARKIVHCFARWSSDGIHMPCR